MNIEATKESIRATAAELGLSMTAEFVPYSQSRHAAEGWESLNWKVTLHKAGRPILTTDYAAGVASCPSYSKRKAADGAAMLAYEIENGRAARMRSFGAIVPDRAAPPILPELADVLSALAIDSSVLDHPTYETWAAEYGMDSDSRKGEASYRACLEVALRMRAALGEDGLRRLVTACEGY